MKHQQFAESRQVTSTFDPVADLPPNTGLFALRPDTQLSTPHKGDCCSANKSVALAKGQLGSGMVVIPSWAEVD